MGAGSREAMSEVRGSELSGPGDEPMRRRSGKARQNLKIPRGVLITGDQRKG